MSDFIRSSLEFDDALSYRDTLQKSLSYGVPFLDDATDGIFHDDLIIITARTGGGKTELVTQIALENVLKKKRVHFFALEAFRREITLRLTYKMLCQAFFTQQNWRSEKQYPNFQKWIRKDQQDIFEKFEPEIKEQYQKDFDTLHLYYRDSKFDIDVFQDCMNRIGRDSDLIIIDHLHYFDLDTENENIAFKRTVKKIKEIVSFLGIPVILVCQLRKQNKYNAQLLPDIEEIHGSSDIVKIATRVITAAPAFDQPKAHSYLYPTYMKLLKNRWDGSRCFYTGLTGFNAQDNRYTDRYAIGELKENGSEFVALDDFNKPDWSRK